MKIASVDTFAVRAPMREPRGPSILLYRAREAVFVKLTTDTGLVGWGETYQVAGVESTIRAVLAPLLVGRDPLTGRQLRQELLEATFDSGFAVSAVDIALHDVVGKALGVPVHVLYGGAVRPRVAAYASLPGYHADRGPEDHWLAETTTLAAGGFRAMKLRIGRFPAERELPLLHAVQHALGAQIRLMVDGNAGYTPGAAVRVGHALADMGFAWFEEPLPQSGYFGYPELRTKLSLPLAGGESLTSRAQADSLLKRGCFDIIQPDVSICGGIAETLFIGDLARLSAVQCIPHCWGGGIMLAATIQLVALLHDPSRLPGFESPAVELDVTENPFRSQLLVGDPFALHDGYLELPRGPGLGVEIDETVLERYAV